MPKQPKDLAKANRVRFVLEAIENYGKATVEQIVASVAHIMDQSLPDENFRRNIERDIESLVSERMPRVAVEYFHADGIKIPFGEEDKHKNKRKICFLIGSEDHIMGASLLKKHSLDFFPQRGGTPAWSVSDFKSPIKEKQLLFIFNINRSFIALHVPVDEIPLKLFVGRQVNEKLLPNILENIRNAEGNSKASLLLLPDSAISRPILGKRFGHAMFEFSKKHHEIVIQDFASANGTFYQATELRENSKKIKAIKNNEHDDEVTAVLPRILFEDEAKNEYEIPFGELEIMTDWVDVKFDLDKYRFDRELEKMKKLGRIKDGHPVNENGEILSELILPEIDTNHIIDKQNKIADTLPISVKMGSTTFYIVATA